MWSTLRTRTWLRRKTPLKAKGGTRFPPKWYDPEYRLWIRTTHPCAVTNCAMDGIEGRIIVAAHVVRTRGAAAKDHGYLIPLCLGHEEFYHSQGPKTFERRFGDDLQGGPGRKASAAWYAERYREERE